MDAISAWALRAYRANAGSDPHLRDCDQVIAEITRTAEAICQCAAECGAAIVLVDAVITCRHGHGVNYQFDQFGTIPQLITALEAGARLDVSAPIWR